MLDHLQRTSNVDGKGGALRAIAHELAVDEAIDSKEFFEAVEFYLRVRKVCGKFFRKTDTLGRGHKFRGRQTGAHEGGPARSIAMHD